MAEPRTDGDLNSSAFQPMGARQALTVWGRTSSSNTQKVLWTLAELGLPYTLVPASARLGPNSQLLGSGEVFGVVDTRECAP